jgi:U3 small nucleolar RNA-associated protein 4
MGETTTLSVHRCRFVDFNPSSVTALAFPPLPLPSIKGKRKATTADRVPKFGPLIVGHANGNIEIYEWTGSTDTVEAPQAWVVRKVRAQSVIFCGIALMQFFPPDTLGVEPIQSRLPRSHPQASR